jgi:predicted CXXCH cytochrome family protein
MTVKVEKGGLPAWTRLCVLAAAMTLAVLAGANRLQAQTPAPQVAPVEKPRGDAEITVVLADAMKFTSCTVYAREQVFSPASADEKSLALRLPAEERIAFTADARVGTGESVARYMGTAEASVDAGKTKKVKITLKPIKDIDSYCRECHPTKGQKIPRGQIVRDVHVSGKPLEGKYLDQVKAHNTKAETLRKEGKPANEPILLEERIVKVAGKDVKKQFYTCESCHTLHAVTPFRKYARAEFLEKSDLCLGCHY